MKQVANYGVSSNAGKWENRKRQKTWRQRQRAKRVVCLLSRSECRQLIEINVSGGWAEVRENWQCVSCLHDQWTDEPGAEGARDGVVRGQTDELQHRQCGLQLVSRLMTAVVGDGKMEWEQLNEGGGMQINGKVQRGRVGCERTDPGDTDGSEHSPIRNALSAQK